MVSQVWAGCFLGNFQDGLEWDHGPSLCVLEPRALPEFDRGTLPRMAMWVPIIRRLERAPFVIAVPAQLDAAAAVIDRALNMQGPFLLFCGAGVERAPLALAWHMVKRSAYTWDEAYAEIGKHRAVMDRREWVPLESR